MSPIFGGTNLYARGAAASQPKRFIFVMKSSGLTPSELVPRDYTDVYSDKGDGKFHDLTLQGKTLSDSLMPLTPFTDQLTIMQGLSAKVCGGGHYCHHGFLAHRGGNGDLSASKPAAGVTIDTVLGNHLPGVYDVLGLAPVEYYSLSTVKTYSATVSAFGYNRPRPFYSNPRLCYNDLFGSVLGGEAKKEMDLKLKMMDYLKDDINKMSRQFKGNDRDKLERYASCFDVVGGQRKKISAKSDVLKKYQPVVTDQYDSLAATDRIEAYFDMIPSLLLTGLTSVLNVRIDNLAVTYDGLGLTGGDVHTIGHGNATKENVPSKEARNRIRNYHMKQIAGLAGKLSELPEGEGSMLDNTLIIYCADNGESHHSSHKQAPFVLVGGKNIIKNNGRYLQYPTYNEKGHHTTAAFFLSLLHAIGKPQAEFGVRDRGLDGEIDQFKPLGELVL